MCTVRVVLTRGNADGTYVVEDFAHAHARVTNNILSVYRQQGPSHASEEVLAAFPPQAYLYWTWYDQAMPVSRCGDALSTTGSSRANRPAHMVSFSGGILPALRPWCVGSSHYSLYPALTFPPHIHSTVHV